MAKSVGGITTTYLVDTNNATGYAQVVEESQGGTATRTYTYGHDLISQRQLINGEWSVSYYGYDGHGSVRLLTDTSGAVTDTYTYDAFGSLIARTGSTPNEYLFAGERFDSETGMYHLRARYMQPNTGRFWSMDSYEGQSADPITLHKYGYTGSNPIDRHDPSGHDFNLQTALITVAIIGSLTTLAALPAIYNSHFRGRSGGNEPVIEIEDQPVIVAGTGWDAGIALTAHSAAVDFWRREANILIKQLPPIILEGCNGAGDCTLGNPITDGNNLPPTLRARLKEKGVSPKHATFFVNSILPPGRSEIPGYHPIDSEFALIGPSAQGWLSTFGTLSWTPAGATVTHEWGHTFGLSHSGGGIMYEFQSNPYYFGRYLSDSERMKARAGAAKYK